MEKTMKNIIYLIVSGLWLLVGCSHDDLMFESKPNLYFDGDSTVFSWLRTQNEEETVYLPCKLVGQAPQESLTFSLEVISGESTAEEGLHYAALPTVFEWPAHAFEYAVPIVIYQKDVRLSERFFRLKVRLQGSGDLQVNYTGNKEYVLSMGAQVVKPVYWDAYNMSAHFGAYSKKKHTIVVQLAQRDFPESVKDYKSEMAFWQNFGIGELNTYFKEHSIKDENGNVIEPWV